MPSISGLNRLCLCVAVLSASLHAQAIIGTWQGSLPISVNPRIIVRIARAGDGSLTGAFYWIDKYADRIPLSSVSFVPPNLNVLAIAVEAGFQGKLSDDGKLLIGTWTEDKKSYPLSLALTAPENIWKHETSVTPLAPMAATADPAFEVATIKPSVPGATGRSFALRSRQFAAKNSTVADLMKFAYKVRSRQIENAPAWFDEQRFDIAAEPDVEGQPNEDQYRLMLRKLLTDRFQLKMHSVQKVFPVYALTVEKATSKLTRSEPGGLEHAHIVTKELADTEMLAQFLDATMFEFADILMNFIPERQIVDETGLKGRFDFPVTLPLSAVQGTGDPDEKVTAFFGALQPLGLRLVPKKESIEVFVIERLEKPSAN